MNLNNHPLHQFPYCRCKSALYCILYKYNQYIVKEKERQLRAMHILKQYINDIIVTGKLTDEDLEKTKKEEINILREIHSIKQNLDELVKI